MNKSSTGMLAVIIVFLLLISLGLYLTFAGTMPATVVVSPTSTPTTVAPVVPPTTTQTTVTTTTSTTPSTTATTSATTSTPFVVTAAQKQALIKYGISSSSVPATISVTQEACFVKVLGAERVAEIKGGAVPSLIEFAKAKGCL